MATVRKRSLLKKVIGADGKRSWVSTGEIRWQVDYRDSTGTRRHKMFKMKADAVTYETRVRTELAAGTHVADGASITVQGAGDLWLERADREGLEAGTIRQYRQHIKFHITPLIGGVKLSKLSTPAIEKFRDDLLVDRSRPLARAVLTSLKGVLKEAKRRGLIGHNPAAETTVKLSRRDKSQTEIPTKDEIRALLIKSAELWPYSRIEMTRKREQKIIAVPWRPFIVTAVFTGLRCSELRGLIWQHVDLAKGIIRVRQRADFQNTMGSPKSEAGNRDVPLAPMVTNTLRSWQLACPTTNQGLVFPTENGTIHSNSNIHKQCWAPLQRAAGIVETVGANDAGEPIVEPKLTFHSLRHAAASLFIEQGWTPKKVQVVMGHSSIQVTFDTYGHLFKTPEDDLAAMAQIEARLLA